MTRGHRQSRTTVALAALVAALLGAGTALAGGAAFSDVPPEHPFFDEIEAIALAGITTGFDDGTYRPGSPVSRGAMAAFMGRGFGRTQHTTDTLTNLADGVTGTLASVSVAAGASGQDTSGYVIVSGTAQLSVPVSDCQCTISAELRDDNGNGDGPTRTSMSNTVNVLTINTQTVAVQDVFEIDGDDERQYRLRVRVTTAGANTGITVSGDLTATYVPFNGQGNVH